MFAKLAIQLLSVSALISGAVSKPVRLSRDVLISSANSPRTSPSFNNWGGFSSMSNFDNFYGSGNFVNSHSTQVVEQEQHVVCHSEQIEIIQQRLVVLQEMAKRIITEQICEVETQTIVFQQFHASLGSFSSDLTRQSGHQVGYDSSIASHYGSIYNSDGSFNSQDLGFSGSSVGSSTVVPSGSNWNDQTSPASVGAAYSAAQSASSS
ncbi:hypothetical protein BD779DRAFT_1609027 [Infundibulicybe gibba]|nr:hypothetical protein BD779DRAFT_1609027 [Infundibulicybe gibba]